MSVKYLTDYPHDGLVGLNALSILVYYETSTEAAHFRGHWATLKGTEGDPRKLGNQCYMPLGVAVSKLCDECLEAETLTIYTASKTPIMVINASLLAGLIDRFNEVHEWRERIEEMDAIAIREALMVGFLPEDPSEYTLLAEQCRDWVHYFGMFPWHRTKPEELKGDVLKARERFDSLDHTLLNEYYARAIIPLFHKYLPGSKSLPVAYARFIEEQVKEYGAGKGCHLVNVDGNAPGEIRVLTALYGYKGSTLLVVPDVVIDYMSVTVIDHMYDIVSVDSRPADAILENVLGLYERNSLRSPFQTLRAAYEAAITV